MKNILTNQFSVKVQKCLSRAALDIPSQPLRARRDRGAGRNIAIQKLRSENRPCSPPGTFPARGGPLRTDRNDLGVFMKIAVQRRCSPFLYPVFAIITGVLKHLFTEPPSRNNALLSNTIMMINLRRRDSALADIFSFGDTAKRIILIQKMC
jgi:hypothetical protein